MPKEFDVGSQVWVWLGSDNKKGVKTAWKQGIRALATCVGKQLGAAGQFQVVLDEILVLSETIDKNDLLQFSPVTYARELWEASIVGLNNYASQVVQIVEDREFATIAAMIAEMLPDVQNDIILRVPAATTIVLQHDDGTTSHAGPEPLPLESLLSDDDPIYKEIEKLLITDRWGGVLLIGAPGTGKSWYAKQVAIKLTSGNRDRIREVQFHPSYQYEDFMEGYVPDGRQGFRLVDKHLLEMAALAKREDGNVVLVIDEFSRTDPARVLGEAMTYMERSLRDEDFFLPSGRQASIPRSLYFIATMNPEDRSVEELDGAMERRWAKVELKPSVAILREFLADNAAPGRVSAGLVPFFEEIQSYMQIGHAFFRNVSDVESANRLWRNQLQYILHKKYKNDEDSRREIDALWAICSASMIGAPQGDAEAGGDPQ